ncbi:cytochrome-c oxidase, cbb3-type subunit III [Kineobactrum sediminis]|uniref:Cbb3-type cytochrome c oxidase subunit n=1 Tax=Kineobactrum sediminis TaxID=1905677 RepID=A0A2N5Y416_9GAMM|nr:cytochrome-c oxidase, cbb3-type subunit III [Kineobactrum sediminis]PLW83134.1 cytochrome-c oxidase, cbb3-type subunit III [Kineobactrum sediminis]
MASFWSYWIIILTTIMIVGTTWVLFANRKTDDSTTERTTGHVYDGIEEYDNPLPAWWFYMFVITIVWAIAYLVVYPGMGNYPGLIGWTQQGQYEAEVEAAEERYGEMRSRYLAMPVAEIAQDPAVRKMGMRLFGNNCAQCHGADAKGRYGFPNLTDDQWQWGSTPDAIKETLVNGRRAVMPGWESVLGSKGIAEATEYVLSLNGRETDPGKTAAGAKHYATYCSACHGQDAKGQEIFGAPNLTNGIWLYGGSREQISHTLRAGRNGVMPAFKDSLTEDKIHILSAYVYSLSN